MIVSPKPAITCSKLTIETLEQGVKCVQINNKDTRTTPSVQMILKVNAHQLKLSMMLLI